ncbi:MAG: hypothetical protein IJQ39_06775 [Thermoguttaceae bacterium]|nr:hypothetical protein [Thermoguttaceae bacterium]
MTDAIIAFTTAINVCISIMMCIFTGRMAMAAMEQTKTSKRQIEEMIRQYNETNRPVVIASFEIIRSGYLCLKLENIGSEVAKDIKIRINDEFLDNLEKATHMIHLRETTEATLLLTSHQKRFIPMGTRGWFDQIARVPAIIDISYNDKYEEHTEIDLEQFRYTLTYNSDLGEISQGLKDIEQHFKHIERNLKGLEKEAKSYHNNLIEAISKINPVSFLVNTGYERRKFETYKAVCLNPDSTTERIAEIVEISKEEALDILMELERVDSLVQSSPCDDDAFHTKWYRNVRNSWDYSPGGAGWI